MILIGSFLLIAYGLFTTALLGKIYNGIGSYFVLYLICFLPIYSTFQLIIFKAFQSIYLVEIIRFSKDFVFASCFLIYVFGKNPSILTRSFNLSTLDKLILSFNILVLIYLFLPIGEATFLSKIIYAKNVFAIGIVYYFGRNINFDSYNWNKILGFTIFLTLISFIVGLCEFIFGVHLHSLLDLSNFNIVYNDLDPEGNYGLTWTFESQNTSPRYASFFADPLEFSASLILFLSISLWYFLHSKSLNHKLLFLVLILIIMLSFSLSFSRASIFSSFILFLIAFLLTNRLKMIVYCILFALIFLSYIFYFSSDDLWYLIEDTITFQSTSSLGHLLEWIQGILSIYENPFGIGLAMSGNAGGVDRIIKVGGENQFLIYGVQMGIISILLYFLIMSISIRNSFLLYLRSSNSDEKSIGFIAGLTKFGLLIPLLTANAELYLFVALFSWYLVGQVESIKFINNSSPKN